MTGSTTVEETKLDIRSAARIAEGIEARAQCQIWQSMPDDMAAELVARWEYLGGALLTIMGKSTSKSANRVSCLGLDEAAHEEMIDEIIDRYRAAKARCFSLHLSPAARPKSLPAWLTARGLKQQGQYAILVRGTHSPYAHDTELSVRRIGKRHASAFAEIVCDTFGWPASRIPWLAATVGRPGFHHYVAFHRNMPVATGTLYVEGDRGWLGLGATLTPYRRQGAQRSIIAARIRQAAAEGCEWVTAETLEPLPGRPQGSYRNLVFSGFELAYLRPIYVWDDRVRA